MDTSMATVVPPFRRRWFGYDRAEVDQFLLSTIAECRAQLEEARKTDTIRAASGEIAALLRSFAESVAIMHDEAERKAAHTLADAERKAADTVVEAERRASDALAEAHADSTRIRDDAVAVARAATDEAETRKLEGERVLGEARLEAERLLEDARRESTNLVTARTSELDSRFKAINAQRMMSEQEVARAAEHLAGVLSALRSLDGLTAEATASVPASPQEPTNEPGPSEPPPIAVDLNERQGFAAVLTRWAQTP